MIENILEQINTPEKAAEYLAHSNLMNVETGDYVWKNAHRKHGEPEYMTDAFISAEQAYSKLEELNWTVSLKEMLDSLMDTDEKSSFPLSVGDSEELLEHIASTAEQWCRPVDFEERYAKNKEQ